MQFVGKVAVVTGGGRGIGRAISAAFAHESAAVAVAYHEGAAEAQGVVEALRKAGRRALAVRADVAKAGDVRDLVAQVLSEWERLDVLVNNAGIVRRAPLTDLTLREWQDVIDTNLTGALLCAQTAGPFLHRYGGVIVNVSSVSGLIGGGSPAYDASKGALITLTKTLARMLAPHVRVNTVAPGFTNTAMHDELSIRDRTSIMEQIPLGRFAEPDEIAKAVVFLASPRAAYITGQTLVVDGGLTMW